MLRSRKSRAGAKRGGAGPRAAEAEAGRKTILLLRHGATALNAQRRFIGSTDVSLSSAGRQQLTTAARLLHAYNPDRCLCSPMQRCLETARIVLADSELEPELFPDLREINFGRWEKMTFEEIRTTDAAQIQRWAKFDAAFGFPGGERLGSFIARVRRAARQIASAPQRSIVVITHGGVIRLLICHFLGLPLRHYVLFEPGPGSLTAINLFDSGKGTLAALVPCGPRREG